MNVDFQESLVRCATNSPGLLQVVMKKNKQPTKKLGLNKITIGTLSTSSLAAAAGGMRPASHSVCGDQSCDTDRYTNCVSRPMHCTN
jgi:hypothetical protein